MAKESRQLRGLLTTDEAGLLRSVATLIKKQGKPTKYRRTTVSISAQVSNVERELAIHQKYVDKIKEREKRHEVRN